MVAAVQLVDDESIRAEYLVAEDLKIATSIIYQAYVDDPVFLEIFQSDKVDYEQRLRAMIREELLLLWEHRQPIVGLFKQDTLVGIACLVNVQHKAELSRFWHWRLKMLLSAGYFSTKQLIEKEKTILAQVPFDNFHMLSFIAIHPAYQQQGFGQYLISSINTLLTDGCDSKGIVVFATQSRHKDYFEKINYQFLSDICIGNVHGSLLVNFR